MVSAVPGHMAWEGSTLHSYLGPTLSCRPKGGLRGLGWFAQDPRIHAPRKGLELGGGGATEPSLGFPCCVTSGRLHNPSGPRLPPIKKS